MRQRDREPGTVADQVERRSESPSEWMRGSGSGIGWSEPAVGSQGPERLGATGHSETAAGHNETATGHW
jgi:hypothetical protein